jgi:TIR domain
MTVSSQGLMLRRPASYDGGTRRREGCLVLNEETPFFLSYPRIDAKLGDRGGERSSDRLVRQFYDDLCQDVAPLVHLQYGSDMGFIDIEDLPGGMNWHPELMRALGTCQVLVGLLSVPYLTSEWCGKEWHAFALRHKTSQASANPHQGCIIPVRWAPIAIELPAVVKDHVSIFTPTPTQRDPELPQRYRREGIFGLLQAGERDAVSEIVWQLAKLIQAIYYSQRLEPRHFEPHELENAFREGES